MLENKSEFDIFARFSQVTLFLEYLKRTNKILNKIKKTKKKKFNCDFH